MMKASSWAVTVIVAVIVFVAPPFTASMMNVNVYIGWAIGITLMAVWVTIMLMISAIRSSQHSEE